ncbi:hypothetical protein OXX69_000192 [Metschnikowia pulcherrima]
MKIVNLAVLAFASCILAKNIIYLDDLVSAMNKDKREAKNIVSLDALKDEAANAVYDGNSEKNAAAPGQKRDTQHVFQPTAPLLQSLLPSVRKISVFSGYLRSDTQIMSQLENSGAFSLILAPTDEAFSRFSAKTGRKPWEYPQEIKNDETDDAVVKNNLRYFVNAHVSAPIDRESSEQKPITLLDGKKIAVERLSGDDNYQVNVDGVIYPVVSIHQAENGVVFVVDSVLV